MEQVYTNMKMGLDQDMSSIHVLYIQPLLNRGTQAVIRALAGSGVLLKVAIALCLALWTWRTWRFAISPALHPERPKEMPYWIPFLGHTISFVRDSQKTLDRAKRFFNDSCEIYAVTLGGESLYVVTNPEDINAVYKNSKSLNFDGHIQDMMRTMEVQPATIQKMFHVPDRREMTAVQRQENPRARHFIDLTQDRYVAQLSPGPHLDLLKNEFLRHLDAKVQLDYVHGEPALLDNRKAKKVSLLRLCRDVIVESNTSILFGEKLLQIDPELPKTFCTFDNDHWIMLYKLPRLLFGSHVYNAQENIKDVFKKYLKYPESERPGAAWLVNDIAAGMRAMDIIDDEIATQFFLVFWSANANGYKLAFWMLVYILSNPALHAAILAEITPAFTSSPGKPSSSSSSRINDAYLLDRTPRLEAVYLEILRLNHSPASTRTVLTDTTVGNKLLRADAKLLIPYRQLHLDPAVFGPTATTFDADRFLTDKGLRRSQSYRPYGGGITYCPGRFLARQEVLMFVGMVLWRFEVRVVGSVGGGKGGGFPRPEDRNPPIGLMAPRKGDDVLVMVREAERAVQA